MSGLSLRHLAVIAATAFAIATPAGQAALGVGLSQRDFAADGNSTLRAAGYAFSIWGLIYAGLVAHAIWQALPANRDNAFARATGWPAAFAVAGCGGWIIAAAADAKWASMAIIVASAFALTLALLRAPMPGRRDWAPRLLALWPLGLLAGWLTIASALNILTVLTAKGLIEPQAASVWAFSGIALVALLAFAVLQADRITAYGVPIAWGLVAVWAAEQTQRSAVAVTALLAGVLVATFAVWTLNRRSGL